MSKVGHDHPSVVTVVGDQAANVVGVHRGRAGPFAMVRPVDGGDEWQAPPENVAQRKGGKHERE
ncbi:hypothetical protein [Streptomyces avicenniae]|uniref:hypothetical protein n=1 Tax=Streptomyces avicenniae TaxID=500153 RepID=UPI00069C36DE|nr:hypothetical protein [Streptomyces avicenniae]